ncbi:MAG: hypothetical protein AB7V12_13375 [Candidatus Dadabacteria bacterium]
MIGIVSKIDINDPNTYAPPSFQWGDVIPWVISIISLMSNFYMFQQTRRWKIQERLYKINIENYSSNIKSPLDIQLSEIEKLAEDIINNGKACPSVEQAKIIMGDIMTDFTNRSSHINSILNRADRDDISKFQCWSDTFNNKYQEIIEIDANFQSSASSISDVLDYTESVPRLMCEIADSIRILLQQDLENLGK